MKFEEEMRKRFEIIEHDIGIIPCLLFLIAFVFFDVVVTIAIKYFPDTNVSKLTFISGMLSVILGIMMLILIGMLVYAGYLQYTLKKELKK